MLEPKKAQQVKIRLAAEGDEQTIAGLILAAYEPFRGEYTPDGFEYTAASSARVRERFSEGPIWIAAIDGEAVGTVSVLPDGERLYVRSMAVRPSAQGRGVGQALLDTIEAHARSAGFRKIYLYTTYVLPAAGPLYEKNGFYIVRNTEPEEWYGMGGIEMEKELTS